MDVVDGYLIRNVRVEERVLQNSGDVGTTSTNIWSRGTRDPDPEELLALLHH